MYLWDIVRKEKKKLNGWVPSINLLVRFGLWVGAPMSGHRAGSGGTKTAYRTHKWPLVGVLESSTENRFLSSQSILHYPGVWIRIRIHLGPCNRIHRYKMKGKKHSLTNKNLFFTGNYFFKSEPLDIIADILLISKV